MLSEQFKDHISSRRLARASSPAAQDITDEVIEFLSIELV
jgi:hypothetical protein